MNIKGIKKVLSSILPIIIIFGLTLPYVSYGNTDTSSTDATTTIGYIESIDIDTQATSSEEIIIEDITGPFTEKKIKKDTGTSTSGEIITSENAYKATSTSLSLTGESTSTLSVISEGDNFPQQEQFDESSLDISPTGAGTTNEEILNEHIDIDEKIETDKNLAILEQLDNVRTKLKDKDISPEILQRIDDFEANFKMENRKTSKSLGLLKTLGGLLPDEESRMEKRKEDRIKERAQKEPFKVIANKKQINTESSDKFESLFPNQTERKDLREMLKNLYISREVSAQASNNPQDYLLDINPYGLNEDFIWGDHLIEESWGLDIKQLAYLVPNAPDGEGYAEYYVEVDGGVVVVFVRVETRFLRNMTESIGVEEALTREDDRDILESILNTVEIID